MTTARYSTRTRYSIRTPWFSYKFHSTRRIFVALLLLAIPVLFFASASLLGWLIMLGMGIVHSFAPSVPAVGFWPCFGLGVILTLIKSALSSNS